MNLRALAAAAVAICVIGSAGDALAQQERRYIALPPPAADMNLPFSAGVLVGDTLYLSGTIGVDENMQLPDSAEAEAAAALDSMKATLEEAGMSMDDLVYVQVFCSDVANYDAFNSVYRTYFEHEYPARAFVGAGTLLFGARFEVQAIAVKRQEP